VDALTTSPRLGRRGLPLVLAAILLGAWLLAPTVGQAVTFLTKQKAKKLYLGNTAVATSTSSVPDGRGTEITVLCPPGRQATHGGASSPVLATTGSFQGMTLLDSYPLISGGRSVGWVAQVFNRTDSGPPLDITAYAVCVP
jgi:hypothetical protein